MSDGPDASEVRIRMKPQTWLFALNLVVQPGLFAMFAWMALDAEDNSMGSRVFGVVMALVAAALFVFAVMALVRTRGRAMEIVVGQGRLEVPHIFTGGVKVVPLADVVTAAHIVTDAGATSFHMLRIDYRIAGETKKRSVVVSSQFVGPEGFDRLRDALRGPGVPGA